MSDVIEHFKAPWEVLSRLTAMVKPGGLLFLNTGNAESLTAKLFGRDWEGYSDYSHFGIEQMTPGNIRAKLAGLSWEILELNCLGVWHLNEDSIFKCLNNLWGHDHRFQRLLAETETGDFIYVVARKTKR